MLTRHNISCLPSVERSPTTALFDFTSTRFCAPDFLCLGFVFCGCLVLRCSCLVNCAFRGISWRIVCWLAFRWKWYCMLLPPFHVLPSDPNQQPSLCEDRPLGQNKPSKSLEPERGYPRPGLVQPHCQCQCQCQRQQCQWQWRRWPRRCTAARSQFVGRSGE